MCTRILLFLLLFAVSSEAFAAPGDLDPTFNPPSGLVFYDPGETGAAVVVQEDRKILVAGSIKDGSQTDVLLLRYNFDGLLDSTFGTNGVVIYGTPTKDESAAGVVVQEDEKVLVTGVAHNGTNNDVLILRYTPGGQLDITFGTNGVFTYNGVGNGDDFARMGALHPQSQKIVVVGTTFSGTNNDVLILTLNTDGSPDYTFGTNGAVIFNGPASGDDTGEAVDIQPDGKILVAGSSFNGPTSEVLLLRLDSNGSFDPNFAGGDGIATYGVANSSVGTKAIALQDDGKILLAGGIVIGVSLDLTVMRFNGNGIIDTTFGPGGIKVYGDPNLNESAKAVALQPDGKIIVAGIADNGNYDNGVLLRYTTGGKLDADFGVGGTLIFNLLVNSAVRFNGAAVQPDGKILVTGGFAPGTLSSDVLLLRLIGQEFMEIPVSQENFYYSPAIDPEIAVDPSHARPMGVGPIVAGGNIVNLHAAFPQFSGPVDIYLGFYAPSIDGDVWLIGAGNALQRLSQGLVKWKENVPGPFDESLFGNIQMTDLSPGPYHLYQMVTPPGNMAQFYFWTTEFMVP